MASDEAFETSEDELRQMGWLSPEDRKAIAQGIDFLATTHHEGQHTAMIQQGMRWSTGCDAKSCKYATELLTWLKKEERT
jgi:hypothetical protein